MSKRPRNDTAAASNKKQKDDNEIVIYKSYTPKNKNTIAGIVKSRKDMKILQFLMANLKVKDKFVWEILDDTSMNFTLFAPNDDAFVKSIKEWKKQQKFPEGELMELIKESKLKQVLIQVLNYHILSGIVTSDLIKDGATPTTVEGKNLCISVVKGKVKLNGTINVIQTDIMNKKNSNGVVHVIDGVLYPIDNCVRMVTDGATKGKMK